MMDQRDSHIDCLRLLACFGVVMLHSSTGIGFGDLALNALFRFSVPVFVIISGWFQLRDQIPPERLRRKCIRLFGKLILWAGIYLVYYRIKNGTWPEDWVIRLFTEPYHLWYLYAAIGLYLLTPALYPFVRSARQWEYRYALGFCFAFGCVGVTLVRLDWIPILSAILDMSKLPTVLGFLFLYLLGGYFRRFGLENRKFWLTAGILSAVVSIISSHTVYKEQLLSFFAPNVALSGGACFVLHLTRKPIPERFRTILAEASGCTMGVYLLHPLVSKFVKPRIRHLQTVLFSSGYMLLCCACIFTVTFGIVWLLSRWKPLKKFLF